MSPGPFQDSEGATAHLEMETLPKGSKAGQQEVKNLRRDLLTSVFELARNAAIHRPKLIWGVGQGAVVAAAYSHPRCFEHTLMTRNAQSHELPPLNRAWGNVAVVVIHAPRIAKRDVQQSSLETAVPVLFQPPPTPGIKLVSFRGPCLEGDPTLHYHATACLLEALRADVYDELRQVPLEQLGFQLN